MSYKQGIPLLDAFDDFKDDDSDDDVENVVVRTRHIFSLPFKCSWKHWMMLAVLTIIILCAVMLGISLPFAITQKSTDQQVIKSPYDTRQYSFFTLDNGLRVLVISDNETQISAAAMDVAVGSFSDPYNFSGLAHFCEHMLFYASQKYPIEGEYSNFLSKHGGYDNAYTSFENTNYFFKVDSNYLEEALDRFAQFFIAPILSQDGVSREVNAVDAEHRKNLENDDWRLWQLTKNVSNPLHPFHKFNTGSLETLNKPNLLDTLIQFYTKYYSANQMQLVIYGKQNIHTLTNYAKSMFSGIPNNNKKREFFTNTSFPTSYNGQIIYYVPVANKYSVHIYWQIQPLRQRYREHAGNILTGLFGHEGYGSILHYLKSKQLATALTCGIDMSTDTYSLLVIDISLTEQGLVNISEVISTVIQYAMLLQKVNKDEWKCQWNEFVDIQYVNFNYSSKISPDSYVSNLASRMRYITSPADFLSPPQRDIFNYTLLSDIALSLTPATPIIFIGAKDISNIDLPHSQYFSLIEPIYQTHYQKQSITTQIISMWNKVVINGLNLPTNNQFIPRNFKILPPSANQNSQPIKVDSDNADGLSIWWFQDTQFLQPKVDIVCNLYYINQNVYNLKMAALNMLYVSIVSTIINPELYPSGLVGYSTKLIPDSNGIHLTISGYSDSTVVNKIIKILINAMINETLISDPDVYSLAMDSINSYLTNYNFTSLPYHYVYQYIQSIVMERPQWKHWQILQVLQSIDSTDLLLNNIMFDSLLCFFHGNVKETQALNYGKLLSQILSYQSTDDPLGTFLPTRLSLSAGNYSVIIPTLNPNDSNSVVNIVFQIGNTCDVTTYGNCSNTSIKTTAIASLLNLQIQQSCFDVLRTQQQLGYVAYCTLRTNRNISSFQVLVQSGTKNISLILNRIDKFLLSYSQNLTQLPNNIASLKDIYQSILDRKDIDLFDSTNRLWYQISSGLRQFNYNDQVKSVLNSITKNDIINFYNKFILSNAKSKKLVIAIYGKGKDSTLDTFVVHSIDYTNLNPNSTGYPN